MYNCEVCGCVRGPGLPLLKHTIYRDKPDGSKEVHQEIPVCSECQTLSGFTPIGILIRQKGKVRKVVAVPVPSIRPAREDAAVLPLKADIFRQLKPSGIPVIRRTPSRHA